MHPIEWLRAIARSEDVPHGDLASEAAAALAALAGEPLGMLPACRRLLDRHPEVGPLWWACARMLCAADGHAEARAIQGDLAADQVGLSLALDLPRDVEVSMVGWSPLAREVAQRRPDLEVGLVHDGGTFADLDGPGADPPDRGHDQRITDLEPDLLHRATGGGSLLLVDGWAAAEAGILANARAREAALAARQDGTEAWAVVGVGRRLPEPLFHAVRRRVAASSDRRLAGADLLTHDDVTRVVEPLVIPCPCPPELL
ncbi:MAG: hypothetical protein ACRD2C_06370 [Acidimicrobiales bacterium]